jgi:opacity protein-like surface antigen
MRFHSCTALALLLLAGPASAQVGHDPASSPYRTLRYGQFLGMTAGYFNGDGGNLGLAPHKGATVGLRYDFLAAGTVTVSLAGTFANTERLIVNPHNPIETAVTGPVKQSVTILEGIIQFNITGGKSWRGIAPFVSAGIGLGLGQSTPADTSGFKFKAKAMFTPGIGARIFLSERLFLRIEARSPFWQLSYPAAFRLPPSTDPTKPPVLVESSGKEWMTSGWYSIGLSYAFHRPF